jgi:hypothetical protein
MSKEILYVDTCVVIEATRTACWNAVAGQFEIRTVAEVYKELATKPDAVHGYVNVDLKAFRQQAAIEQNQPKALLQAAAKSAAITALDPGERDLLAHAFVMSGTRRLVTTGDKAAVRIACSLGLSDRLISLEEVADRSGQKPALNSWYTNKWLSDQKTTYLLDTL